ncbi:hypothetical protein DGG96_09950 [Legionella qingyii]|uniref:Amino acid adenylation domain-containing protein n=1 Tax=Legionella qingyii TaxID=2184757 RepID=A0A317U398_9GAMM|nr:non-ribosomal peptide synthetase [Legionella qingyii]PWY55829.1 hypothetical protein DGG96_09950 [Legionella qingyii]RUR23076.1 amino acid adenylation domain-containing protein [Legionella qingyii]RUR26922.1 amino acid adenylation domain-containing protein [Legionella qingyii]
MNDYLQLKVYNIADLISINTQKNPHALAYRFIESDRSIQSLTFAELEAEVNRFAVYVSQYVNPGDRVILAARPGLEYIISFYSCLKSGAIVVPVFPPVNSAMTERFIHIVQDSTPTLVVSDMKTHTLLKKGLLVNKFLPKKLKRYSGINDSTDQLLTLINRQRIKLIASEERKKINIEQAIQPLTKTENIAFLQYTSGSTGDPKGVMLSHANLLDNFEVIRNALDHREGSQMFSWLPPYHDMGLIAGILEPLYANIPSTLMSTMDFISRPLNWLRYMSEYGCTTTGAPNFAFELCIKAARDLDQSKINLSRIEVIANGAEPINPHTLEQFYKTYKACGLRAGTIFPCYGLAEATVMVSAKPILQTEKIISLDTKSLAKNSVVLTDAPDSTRLVSSGVPQMNVVIVNERTQSICQSNEVGEIWVSGNSVAGGYYNNSEATDTIFNNSINEEKSATKFLKTGDLGFIYENELFVCGRFKDLIILNGENYYPQDFEYTVIQTRNTTNIVNCVSFSVNIDNKEKLCILCELDKNMTNQVSSFECICKDVVLAVTAKHEITPHSVYLLPPRTIEKTTSGKVRRKQMKNKLMNNELNYLYAWKIGETEDINQNINLTRTEKEVCDLFTDVLNIQVGIDNQIVRTGIDSIDGIQVVNRIKDKWGIDIDLHRFFTNITLRELASYIDNHKNKCEVNQMECNLNSESSDDKFPLTAAQSSMYFMSKLHSQSPIYHLYMIFDIKGELHVETLIYAINEVVKRHAVFRTFFESCDGILMQRIKKSESIKIPIYNLSENDQTESNDVLKESIQQETEKLFNLETGPLIRGCLYILNDNTYKLLICVHHILVDGWSLSLFSEELTTFYNAGMNNAKFVLPKLPIQYYEYSQQQNVNYNRSYSKLIEYWKNELNNAPSELLLPKDRSRDSLRGHSVDKVKYLIPREVANQLKQMNHRQHTTLFMFLLTAFQVLLSRYSGQSDFVIGIPTTHRRQSGLEKTIGYFINTLPIRATLDEGETFNSLLRKVKTKVLDALKNQDISFDKIVNALNRQRNANGTSLFQVMFVLQKHTKPQMNMEHLDVTVSYHNVASEYDLTLVCEPVEDGIDCSFEYATSLFDRDTIERMTEHWGILLQEITNKSEEEVDKLSLMTPKELQKIVVEWNRTESNYPKLKTLQELFAEMVDAYPNNTALMFNNEKLSYKELDVKTNQLASYLRNNGITSESFVAISLDRGINLIVAILAIVKSGAAFVPLDINYPDERLNYMLNDTKPSLIITQEQYCTRFDNFLGRVVFIEELGDKLSDIRNYEHDIVWSKPNSAAYVMYTSGSTGIPKGVVVEHYNIVRLVKNTNYITITSKDVVAQSSNISFDASTLEIWGALLNGACLCILGFDEVLSPSKLKMAIQNNKISILWLTTSLFHQIAHYSEPVFSSLKYLLVGGEALNPAIASKVMNNKIGKPGYLINGYGPTENTTFTTTFTLKKEMDFNKTIPIGSPISNTSVYILDKNLAPVPIGIIGELYAGGDGVSRGYLNQSERTKERFIPDPFSNKPDSKMYKTGDLCRWLKDGTIEYIGRIDNQIKIRGFRVELGEIENLLNRQPQVQESAVVACEEGGEKRLVAYVVLNTSEIKDNRDVLVAQLKMQLPEYMIPSAFMFMDKLPINENGKLDRKALPSPQHVASCSEYVAPRNECESILKQIWEDVLQVCHISVTANFFDLGGHSLKAIELMHAIKQQTGVELNVSTLFNAPTIESMAQLLSKMQSTTSPLVELKEGGNLPVFFVHPVNGNLLGYTTLIKKLDKNQSAYGLQQTPLQQSKSIKEMAAHYINAMKQVQPKGPYRLVGWSLGGVIAHEISYQLELQGERLIKLLMIDSYPLNHLSEAVCENEALVWYDLYHELNHRYNLQLNKSFNELKGMTQQECQDYLTLHAKRYNSTINFEPLFEQIKANLQAGKDHQPGAITADVFHIQASETALSPETWKPYLASMVIYKFAANHYSLLTEPVIDDLVSLLNSKVLT